MFRNRFETQEKSHFHRPTKEQLFAEERKNDEGKEGKYLDKDFFSVLRRRGKI